MKIEKLYTLSQFVDWLERNKSFANFDNWLRIISYNDFLKQPLKKEMFVNPIMHPKDDKGLLNRDYHWKLSKWQEAKKKVIFEDVDISTEYTQPVYEFLLIFIPQSELLKMSLSDLAEATNGELELKNFEL